MHLSKKAIEQIARASETLGISKTDVLALARLERRLFFWYQKLLGSDGRARVIVNPVSGRALQFHSTMPNAKPKVIANYGRSVPAKVAAICKANGLYFYVTDPVKDSTAPVLYVSRVPLTDANYTGRGIPVSFLRAPRGKRYAQERPDTTMQA
jgi:hypothetical protein